MIYKSFDEKKFEKLLASVEEATCYNCHSEALVEISEFVGYPEYRNLFESYSEKESLTMEDVFARSEARKRMFLLIASEYGDVFVERLEKVM